MDSNGREKYQTGRTIASGFRTRCAVKGNQMMTHQRGVPKQAVQHGGVLVTPNRQNKKTGLPVDGGSTHLSQ